MSQINISRRVQGRRAQGHCDHPLAESERGPEFSLLRAMGDIWRQGGGECTARVLTRDFGIFLSPVELERCLRRLVELGYLERTGGTDEFEEYELTPEGVRDAVELELRLAREMSRDE